MHPTNARTWLRSAAAYIAAAALALTMVPLGIVPADQAQASTNTVSVSTADIEAMLSAGDYAPGEAIVVIDNSVAVPASKRKGAAAKALSAATEIMDTSADTYEQATGSVLANAADADISIEYIVQEGADTATLLAELATDPRVLSVEPNYVHQLAAPTHKQSTDTASDYDTYNSSFDLSAWQWSCASTYTGAMTLPGVDNTAITGMGAPSWNNESAASTADCIVAVLDTGVDYNHPELKDVLYTFTSEQQDKLGCGPHGAAFVDGVDPTDPMDDHGHGTHCAGAVAAAWNNAGTSGVAKGVKIMPLKVSDASYVYPEAALLKAYSFVGRAADAGVPVRITSNSYGGSSPSNAQNIALAELGKHGVVSLFASGNERTNADGGNTSNVFPNNPYTIVVDALRPDGKPSSFTNYGRGTDVFVPGVSIASSVPAFDAQYYGMADTNPLLYRSAASTNGAWDSGIVVSKASASLLTRKASSSEIFETTATENAINITQTASTASFDGDNASLEITLGEVTAPLPAYADEGTDTSVASVVYLDFEVPVTTAEQIAYAGISAYVTDYGGTWQFDGDNSADLGKPTIETSLLAKVKKTETGDEGWVRDAVGYCYNENAWQPVGFSLDNACGETPTSFVVNDGKVQMRLRLHGVAGVGLKEGTKIYLDCFGLGTENSDGVLPYLFWDGTSMATPTGAGAAAIIETGVDDNLEPAEHAARLSNLVKACVAQPSALAGTCSSNGRIDLSLLNSDGTFSIDSAAPVINSTTADSSTVAINGFAFGANTGTLTIDGTAITPTSWSMTRNGDSEIAFTWPEGMETGVKHVCVTNAASGKVADKLMLLTAPGAEKQLYETSIGTEGLDQGTGGDIVAMTDLDGVLYALLCTEVQAAGHATYYKSTYLSAYDATKDSWTAVAKFSGQLIGLPTMTSYEGEIFVAGTRKTEEGGSFMSSYKPSNGTLTEWDATNFPAHCTLANCEGELLVIGSMLEDDYDTYKSHVAHWELKYTGVKTPYAIEADDIVCTYDGYSSTPQVAVQGNSIYVMDTTRIDSTSIGIGLTKIVRNADGTCAVTDYTPRLQKQDEYSTSSVEPYGITFSSQKLVMAAGSSGPVIVGTGAYENDALITDADTFVFADDDTGFTRHSKRMSFSTLQKLAAYACGGKLYVAAIARDEAIGYLIRATALSTEKNPGDSDAGLAVGDTATIDDAKYTALSATSVELSGVSAESETFTIPANVTINGKRYAVTGIGSDCFATSAVTKVIVQSAQLEEGHVANCFRGSSVATVVMDTAFTTYKTDYNNYSKYLQYTKANTAYKTATAKVTKAKKNLNKAKKAYKKANKKFKKAKKNLKKAKKARKGVKKAKKKFKKAKKNLKKAKKKRAKATKALKTANANAASAKTKLASLKAYAGATYKNAKAGYDTYKAGKAACAFLADEAVVGKAGIRIEA